MVAPAQEARDLPRRGHGLGRAVLGDGDAVDSENVQTSWQVATDWGALVLSVTAQTTPAPAPHETMVIFIVIIRLVLVLLLEGIL